VSMGQPGWDKGRRPANPAVFAAAVVVVALIIVVTFVVLAG